MENYIFISEYGNAFKSSKVTPEDYYLLKNGLLTIIRVSDLSKLTIDSEWELLEDINDL